jgi:hypothetical protein
MSGAVKRTIKMAHVVKCFFDRKKVLISGGAPTGFSFSPVFPSLAPEHCLKRRGGGGGVGRDHLTF